MYAFIDASNRDVYIKGAPEAGENDEKVRKCEKNGIDMKE